MTLRTTVILLRENKMQFRDLKKQYGLLKSEIDAGIAEVIESAQFISGPKVRELENALAEYTGRKHCISCANGTDALELCLLAWGIGKGDAVFVPSFTFMSTAEVVATVGATPVWVDIDLNTFNMSAVELEKAIEKTLAEGKFKPELIIPVDLFGLPADFTEILPIAEKYGLKVLEDGAQGFGGEINGKKACSFGNASTTSFFPAKPLGCYGDGGAIFTDDDEMASLLRSIAVHGKGREKYENIRLGRNSRLDSIQAAVLLPKLAAFEKYEVDAVNNAARLYSEKLRNLPVVTPAVPDGFLSSWAQYTLLCADTGTRNNLQSALKEQGIPSMIYYPCGLHKQKAFEYCSAKDVLPNTEKACSAVLSLPMHPYLTEADIDLVCNVIKEFFK